MTSPVLQVEKKDGFAVLTLNRPEEMNALSSALRLAIGSAFRELEAEPDVRVIILTGAGRAFCAGMDLKELAGGEARESGHDTSATGQSEMAEGMAAFSGPIIAAVNGHAITGGFELALQCDVLIASSRARFADTHARVGILPGWGLSQKLPRMIGSSRAKEISFTGNFIEAEQALAWGLVNRVVEPDELLPCCQALARDMASCVPEVLRGYKRLIDEGARMPLGEALAWEAEQGVASARATAPGDVAKRREGVVQRGRRSSA
jgi:enoyl-CoA hydratase